MEKSTARMRDNCIVKALMTAIAMAAILSGCSLFQIQSEGIYTYHKEGAPSYYYDDFEANDGTSSTKHYFVRTANEAGEPPKISRDWASEGSWSMRIPAGAALSFELTPKEFGILSFALSLGCPSYIILDGHSNGPESIRDSDPSPDIVRGAVNLDAGSYKVTFPQASQAYYVDEIKFVPFLLGASPDDGEAVSDSPTLDWRDVDGGSPYKLQVSYYEDFTSTVVDISGIGESRYALSGLPSGKCYFWRVQTASAVKSDTWSSPQHFYVAAQPQDDSFETALFGTEALNAWCGGGMEAPALTSLDASSGTHSVRLGHLNEVGEVSYLEMAVSLDSPKVLHYSYKIVGDGGPDQLSVYLQFSKQVTQGTSTTVSKGTYQSLTGGAWSSAAELIPMGESILRWTFVRTAASGNLDSYALVDEIRFEDPPVLGNEEFEPAGGTSSWWGFQGWTPPVLQAGTGVDGSRGAILPMEGRATGGYNYNASLLRLIADVGDEPCILGFETKGNGGIVGTNLYELCANVYTTSGSGWYEHFYALTNTGPQAIDISNLSTSSSITVDRVRAIPYYGLGVTGLAEGFESGAAGAQYFFDRTCQPQWEMNAPHSGSYCAGLKKYAGKFRTFVSFPIVVDKDYTLSFWARAEGTKDVNDRLFIYHEEIPSSTSSLSSEWQEFSFDITKPSWSKYWPLSFVFQYSQAGDYSIYLDDISLTAK